MLTIASLLFVAAGAFLGNSLVQNPSSNSRAANNLSCPRGVDGRGHEGPDVGKDCSGEGITGRKVNCGMRVIADTFDVLEINRGGVKKLLITGNFCFTGDLTSGANLGELYITDEHPGKEACYRVLDIDTHATFAPGSMPLCDQTGQWAKLNPRLPIPNRFRGSDKTNWFSFEVDKPVTGCLRLNTTTNGQQGGGGAGTNFDIWQDPRLCAGGGSPTLTSVPTDEPTPTCGTGRTCPTNTPSPTIEAAKKCNDTCSGAGQCGLDTKGNPLVCTQTEIAPDGTKIYRCRQNGNEADPFCGEETPTPSPKCRKPGDPTPTTKPGDPTPTGPVIVCPSLTPTHTPTPSGTEPTITPISALKCNDLCTPGGVSCPVGHICHEISGTGTMRCRLETNRSDEKCLQVTNTPTPTQPVGGACEFFPISFIFEEMPDGRLVRIENTDKNIWGSLNDRMLDEIKDRGKDEKEFLKEFNNGAGPKGFDAVKGEYDPCKGTACKIPASQLTKCCGFPENKIKTSATPEDRNYNITKGERARVKLFYDDSQYEVVRHCFNDNEKSPADDASSCTTNVKGRSVDPALFDDPKLMVQCGLAYRYGWVLKKKTTGPSCPLFKNECKVQNLKADFRNDYKAKVTWSYPTNCPELKEGTDKFFIDIVDENEKIVCAKTEIADSTDPDTTCVLGDDVERRIDRNITEWEDDMSYHANVWTVQASDNSCMIGQRSNDFNKPDDEPEPDVRSHQLDVWETDHSLGDDCYIAADTASGTNAKTGANHCKTYRNPTANGLDELIVEYTNNKLDEKGNRGPTLRMRWQANTCNGKLLDSDNPVCNDIVNASSELTDLKWGRMLRCKWLNIPSGNVNVTCTEHEAGNLDNSGNGSGSGGSGSGNTGGNKSGSGSRPLPTSEPVGKEKINFNGVINILHSSDTEVDAVILSCVGDCPSVMNVADRVTENWTRKDATRYTYSFEGVEGKNYSVFPIIRSHTGDKDSYRSGGTSKTLNSNSPKQDFFVNLTTAPIFSSPTPTSGRLPGRPAPTSKARLISAIPPTSRPLPTTVPDPIPGSDDLNRIDTLWTFDNRQIDRWFGWDTLTTVHELNPIICHKDATQSEYKQLLKRALSNVTRTNNCMKTKDIIVDSRNISPGKTQTFLDDNLPFKIEHYPVNINDLENIVDGKTYKVGCEWAEDPWGPNLTDSRHLCTLIEVNGGQLLHKTIVLNKDGTYVETESEPEDLQPTTTFSTSNSAQSTEIICDVNSDTVCNTLDYIQITQRLGTKGPNLTWDLNGDQSVDGADVSLILKAI